MKSYMEHVEYQDLTTAVEKAHQMLESIKSETKNAEYALKLAKKEDKSKFEIGILHLELRRQKLAEESQKVTLKMAELARENWVHTFKKEAKKTEKAEKETAKIATEATKKNNQAVQKQSKHALKITQNGETLEIETAPIEQKKVRATRTRKMKAVANESLESATANATETKTIEKEKKK